MSQVVAAWLDPRVWAGMETLLGRRRELLDAGARPIGWKVAFGPPAVHEPLGLDGPLVGFLTDATLLESGAECAIGDWAAPRLEPEIAIHIGEDLGAGAEPESARAAIAGISAAIELADVDAPPAELERVLSGNIYHRRVVLGPERGSLPEGPIAVAVERDGQPLAATGDAEAAIGQIPALVAYVARYLAQFGCSLAAGDVVIGGSTVPLIEIEPGQAIRSEVAGAGAVAVSLSAGRVGEEG